MKKAATRICLSLVCLLFAVSTGCDPECMHGDIDECSCIPSKAVRTRTCSESGEWGPCDCSCKKGDVEKEVCECPVPEDIEDYWVYKTEYDYPTNPKQECGKSIVNAGTEDAKEVWMWQACPCRPKKKSQDTGSSTSADTGDDDTDNDSDTESDGGMNDDAGSADGGS